jgi:hypothetical protein
LVVYRASSRALRTTLSVLTARSHRHHDGPVHLVELPVFDDYPLDTDQLLP